MARREPTAGGDSRRGRGGRTETSGKRKRRHARGRRRARHHATHTLHTAAQHAPTQPVGERPAAGSVWHAASPSASVAPLLTLAPESAASGALLTLAGAEHGTLGEALLAWGAGSDAAANRAWRRPGGLARLADL